MMNRMKSYSGYARIISSIIIWFLIAAILLSFSAPAFAEPDNSERASIRHYQDVVQALPGVFCALRMDGTVSVVEICSEDGLYLDEGYEQFKENVEGWTDIDRIVMQCNLNGIAGIKDNGGVVLELVNNGYTELFCGECKNWTDIEDIILQTYGVFGLKRDGTVIATQETIRYYEDDFHRRFTFDGWKDIKTIETSLNDNRDYVLLGITEDGTLFYNGSSYFTGDWNGIKDIADADLNAYIYLILRKDGTVDLGGIDALGAKDVLNWRDIIQVKAGRTHAAGLKSDGTVLLCSGDSTETLEWENVVSIYIDGYDNLFAVCEDGTVKCFVQDDDCFSGTNQNEVESWQGIEKLSILNYPGRRISETIVIGYREDGSIVSTRDLSL